VPYKSPEDLHGALAIFDMFPLLELVTVRDQQTPYPAAARAMPEYQFFSVEGPRGTFPSANKAIRSHAMRTALQERLKDAGKQSQSPFLADSEDIVRRKGELKGRFHMRPGGRAKRKTAPLAAAAAKDAISSDRPISHADDVSAFPPLLPT
jgi:hypothetical protein